MQVLYDDALRELQLAQPVGNAVLVLDAHVGGQEIGPMQMQPRHVHRDGHHGQPGVQAGAQVAAHALEHELVEPQDEPVLLEQRDELVGSHDALVGTPPAHERLAAQHARARHVVLRLHEVEELALRERPFHRPLQIGSAQQGVAHGLAVGAWRDAALARLVLGDARAVHELVDVARIGRVLRTAQADVQRERLAVAHDAPRALGHAPARVQRFLAARVRKQQ